MTGNATTQEERRAMTMRISDYDNIVTTIRLYIDGFNEHDPKKFKEAFHEEAQLFYADEDGGLHVRRLDDEIFDAWASSERERPIELRIISVAQMGDVASVALGWDHDYFDFHALIRTDGVWKITNKTASHASR
jgi:Putative lumazine-binding